MRRRYLPFTILVLLVAHLHAQSPAQADSWPAGRYLVSGGYSWLSNSPNGLPGSLRSMNGWDAAFANPAWHHLRFKLDVSHYSGVNLAAQQKALFITAGGQYDVPVRRETFFGEVLLGVGNMNKDWGPNGIVGATASAAAQFGGGLDTALTRHVALRVEADYQYSYFSLSGRNNVPYRIPGLPTEFARCAVGPVVRF
jgi:hypothetical protein